MVWVDDLRPVQALLGRVQYEERSLFRALELGNSDLFGWGKRLTASQRVTPPQPVKQKKERVGVDMRQPVEKMDLSLMVPAKYR